MKLKRVFSSPTHRVETLRKVISRISYSSNIDDLPEQFANVLDLYDRAPLDTAFRNDVHSVLSGAVKVSESMLDETFDVDVAIRAVSDQIITLSRVLNYLSSRPTRIGYSILSPSTGTLLGQFASEGEAAGHLADLRNLGHGTNALVVPVKIISQYSIRPGLREPLTGDIPAAILPVQRSDLGSFPVLDAHPEQVDDPALPAGQPNQAEPANASSPAPAKSTFRPSSNSNPNSNP